MCTVSYLPLTEGGFILTSNRDEAPERNAIEVQSKRFGDIILTYPEDPAAMGSWLAVSDKGTVGCLLNGAYEPFAMGSEFTHSRGIVLLDTVRDGKITTTSELLTSTAPFTLVLHHKDVLCEYVWDGNDLRVRTLDSGIPGFWSSVTLYPEDVRKWRKTLFHKWLDDHPDFTQGSIIEFHKYGSKDSWNGFVMNRNDRVRTLSITSVMKTGNSLHFQYSNLLNGSSVSKSILVQPQHDLA